MAAGYSVAAGQLGENLTTLGIDLLTLPRGTRLTLGSGGALIEVTRTLDPCSRIRDCNKLGLLHLRLFYSRALRVAVITLVTVASVL